MFAVEKLSTVGLAMRITSHSAMRRPASIGAAPDLKPTKDLDWIAVIPGLVPGILVLNAEATVDGRDKPGHDGEWDSRNPAPDAPYSPRSRAS